MSTDNDRHCLWHILYDVKPARHLIFCDGKGLPTPFLSSRGEFHELLEILFISRCWNDSIRRSWDCSVRSQGVETTSRVLGSCHSLVTSIVRGIIVSV